jgi:hypothetical protein
LARRSIEMTIRGARAKLIHWQRKWQDVNGERRSNPSKVGRANHLLSEARIAP